MPTVHDFEKIVESALRQFSAAVISEAEFVQLCYAPLMEMSCRIANNADKVIKKANEKVNEANIDLGIIMPIIKNHMDK